MAATSTKKGSNLLCRVANASPQKVCEYVRRLPKTIMPENRFRDYMGSGWFSNEHQAPEQWGLYYIDGVNYYPRFNRDISEKEAEQYLYGWMKRFIVINPYTRFRQSNDSNLVLSIVSYMESNPSEHDLKKIISNIITNDEPFVLNEILANALTQYSEVLKVTSSNKKEEVFRVELVDGYKKIIKNKYMTKKEYFDLFSDIKVANYDDEPRQQIFYGAPGTGKSHEINDITKGENVIRTTFHPDSDYSTFVGAYKPVMDDVDVHVVPVVFNNSGIGFDKNSGTFNEKRIAYKFVKQAFLKAYLLAWKKYANSKCNNSTTNNNDFETSTGGYYIISSVETNKIILSRKFFFTKKAVLDEWPNLWNGNSFEVPEGPQSGKSVQHAIAKWIYSQIKDCSIDSFEEGWTKLMNDINTLESVDVRKKTTIYNLSRNDNNNEEIIVKVEGAGKSRNNLKNIFEGKESSRKLDNRLVDILKRYDNNFDVAWGKLKDDVRMGANTDEMEAPNADVEPQFLVIEEINRGNCAQIFGDLFQLLDRDDDGFSTYPIEADTDLQRAIKIAFEEEDDYKIDSLEIDDAIEDYTSNYDSTLSEDVKEGRVLLLPPNLYIWATMNTSDQSLFPIDSAFKRRWDWVYKPIGYKNNNWTIEIGNKKYNWVDFQLKINEKIYNVDNSEDKQLGDYFVNADRTRGKISADTLLNKILFYIWNDVCKDDPDQIFQWNDGKDNKSIKFSDFFGPDRDEKLQGFMAFNGISEIKDSTNTNSSVNTDDSEDSEGVKIDTTTKDNNEINA